MFLNLIKYDIHALYYFYHLNFTRDKINDKQDIVIIRKKKNWAKKYAVYTFIHKITKFWYDTIVVLAYAQLLYVTFNCTLKKRKRYSIVRQHFRKKKIVDQLGAASIPSQDVYTQTLTCAYQCRKTLAIKVYIELWYTSLSNLED